ncbi:phage major capsid protein [Listeria booriae]|uniref:phage major capsid protein n=1 Tax=Listeria booriae TaxID=1552123 RepID=UPI001C8BCD40|nr:phage major capsid protein [Listeria booriae]
MKNYLNKRKSALEAELEKIKNQITEGKLERAALDDLAVKVDEISAELDEVKTQLADLEDDDNNADDGDDATGDGDGQTNSADDDDDTRDGDDTTDDGDNDDDDAAERAHGIRNVINRSLSSNGTESNKKKSKKQRTAFINYLAGRISEKQARSFGIAFNNGKVLVPEVLSKEIIGYLQEENPMRKYATLHRTSDTQGFPIQIKKADANLVKTERDTNEIPETEIEFEDVYLDPIEIDALIKVTKKLTLRSEFDVEALVIEELKKAYLRKETYWHFTDLTNAGSLVNKAVEFVGTGADDYLKLVQMKNQLPTAMRSGAIWMMNRAGQTMLESMLDKNGQPLLKDSANDDFDGRILTYNVVVTDYVDTADPSVPVIYFGNFAHFHIQDVIGTLEIEKLDQLFALTNKIGYKIYNLTDGQLVYGPFETPIYRLKIGA